MDKEKVIASTLKAAREAERCLLREVGRCGYSEPATFAIRLAAEEALNNAINHGNRSDPTRKVCLRFNVTDQAVEIEVSDQGGGFNPQAVPDPTADENLEKPCGRGIMLMRAYMDEVHFNQAGNCVRLVKYNR